MKLLHGDCLTLMKDIPDQSIDLILTDPPFGDTVYKWDSVLPFDAMWKEVMRIIKPLGAVVLFGKEPFASRLRLSNLAQYKYDWKWKKRMPGDFFNAKNKPLNDYEDVMVFSWGKTANGNKNNMRYYPQGLKDCDVTRQPKNGIYARPSTNGRPYKQTKSCYPRTVLEYEHDVIKYHPTQKPVALLSYLIKTYTLENETILDFTMGSGSTAIACQNTNRNFIGIELNQKFYDIAFNRAFEDRLKEKV